MEPLEDNANTPLDQFPSLSESSSLEQGEEKQKDCFLGNFGSPLTAKKAKGNNNTADQGEKTKQNGSVKQEENNTNCLKTTVARIARSSGVSSCKCQLPSANEIAYAISTSITTMCKEFIDAKRIDHEQTMAEIYSNHEHAMAAIYSINHEQIIVEKKNTLSAMNSNHEQISTSNTTTCKPFTDAKKMDHEQIMAAMKKNHEETMAAMKKEYEETMAATNSNHEQMMMKKKNTWAAINSSHEQIIVEKKNTVAAMNSNHEQISTSNTTTWCKTFNDAKRMDHEEIMAAIERRHVQTLAAMIVVTIVFVSAMFACVCHAKSF